MAKPNNQQIAFVNTVRPYAETVGKELGIDPDFIIAQAGLESGWGKSAPGNNFFGIKADKSWKGNANSLSTREVEGGKDITKQQNFRAYESPEDSFRDFGNFLTKNPRYAQVLKSGNDHEAYATGLQKAGYATDPNYANGVMATINSVKMAQGKTSLPMQVKASAPVQLAQATPSQAVPEVLPPAQVSIAQAPVDMEWRQLQQAMPAKPVQVADLEYGDQVPMAQPYQFARAQPVQVMQPNFSRFNSWMGKV